METRDYKKENPEGKNTSYGAGLPDKPGVYFFLKTSPKPSPERRGGAFPFQGKAGDEVLYIGKATSLRDRVKSYFGEDLINTRGPLIVDMVFKAEKIDWQETESVLEALILEANLIKKHQPYYNTQEKDDKSFNYVCITDESLPKVMIVRGKDLSKNFSSSHFSSLRPSLEYKGGTLGKLKMARSSVSFKNIFGPYTSGTQLREAVKIIRRIFPFIDEKSKNYMEFYKQINLVPDLDDRKMYLQNIRNIKLFFEGKKKRILKNLQKEMKEYAKMREFEKAGEIKRQIFALQHINDIALLKRDYAGSDFSSGPRVAKLGSTRPFRKFSPSFASRIEAYDIAHMGGKNMVGVMTVVENGEVAKNEYKKFRIRTQTDANDTGALTEVLQRRLSHKEWMYPNLIVVDGGVAQLNASLRVFKNLEIKIPVVSVVKNEKHKPKAILGDEKIIKKYNEEILLANSEAHRFAINYHKNLRAKNFLK